MSLNMFVCPHDCMALCLYVLIFVCPYVCMSLCIYVSMTCMHNNLQIKRIKNYFRGLSEKSGLDIHYKPVMIAGKFMNIGVKGTVIRFQENNDQFELAGGDGRKHASIYGSRFKYLAGNLILKHKDGDTTQVFNFKFPL